MSEQDAPWEEYHVANAKLSEAEWQAMKALADSKGSNVSAEMRIAAQHYLKEQTPPYDEKKTLHFSQGYYLVFLAHWNPLDMPKREREFIRKLLDLVDEFEQKTP